ncbi:hypothetical protein BJV77DRAFT_559920 [Russula vinacea]|nr:hypothetical protein BJV77DRAFT_559920 [Russula vinacea]
MPGVFLHELWKYHQRVRSNLTSDLKKFMDFNALIILEYLSCDPPANSRLPCWIHSYISDIGRARVPAFLDLTDFHMRLTEHVDDQSTNSKCASCSGIPRNKIRALWVDLTAAVCGCIAKAEPDFALPAEGTFSQTEGQARPNCEATSPLPKYTDMPNADVILESSDFVRFSVNSCQGQRHLNDLNAFAG